MSDDKFRAGLDDQEELGQYPSAASPLTTLGLDPDVVRANPDLLKGLGANKSATPPPGMMSAPAQSKPSASAVTAGAVGGAGDPSLTDDAKQGITGELRTAKSMEGMASQLGTVDPSIQKAQQARDAADDAARNFNDAPYEASRGQKIWRGVRGGLTGLAKGGVMGAVRGAVDPESVGSTPYSAPNAEGEAARGKLLETQRTTNRSYDESLENWKRANEARKEGLGATKDAATAFGGAAGHATAETTAEQKPETEANKADEKFKLDQKEFDLRTQRANQLQLKGMNRMLYLLNGKVPDPRQPTEGEYTAAVVANATKVWSAAHGGQSPQTLKDLNEIQQAARGTLGKGDKGDAQEAANLRAAGRLAEGRVKSLESIMKSPAYAYGTEEQRKPIQDELDKAKEELDDIQEQLKGDESDTVPPGGPVAPPAGGPAPGGPQPIASHGQPVPKPAGATHTVKSKLDQKLHWTNADGTVDLGVAQ